MAEVKIGGTFLPLKRCPRCQHRMIDHGDAFPACMSCMVPPKPGETSRAYRRRVCVELGINLRPDGRPFG